MMSPYIVAQNYDDSVVPTVRAEFSEDVSNALNLGYLELINTTTAEQVPLGYLNLTYDAGTNTASFTFPGYPDGALPAGDYTATILGTLPDLFGNQIGAETPLLFTVATPPPALPGDYNRDNFVDAADYTVWRDALGAAVTPYSGADGDGNGLVEQADFDVWVANFGETSSAGSGLSQAMQLVGTLTPSIARPSSDETTLAAAVVTMPESLSVESVQTSANIEASATPVESTDGIAAAISKVSLADESLATPLAQSAANLDANLADLRFALLAPSPFGVARANRWTMAESDAVPTAVRLAPAAVDTLLLLTPEINSQIPHFELDLFGPLPDGSHSTDSDVSLFAVDAAFCTGFGMDLVDVAV